MPEISIIIPVYNAEALMKDDMDSILNQASTDFEQLLDDSSESTEESMQSCKCLRELREQGFTTIKTTV